ncbi:hypothetical protein RND81_07G121200 [Saponaria officinalis]|uniref:Protein kinase domain-containing protein n=1 Tax=Saponaria officinalis TaxID=3572 RepID=A0AAW1JU62_SAPOF
MEWRKGKLIGRGSTADVSLGRNCCTGDVFAVKHTPLSRSSSLQKEVEIHSTLKCAQIIEYKGNDITQENGHFVYNVLLEYASRGTVIDVIRHEGCGLSESKVRGYTREILKGVEYLHSRGIVHCDIKGANILVTNEGVKIGDFGCSKRVDDVAVSHSSIEEIVGTPMYMAPEVARGDQQGYPADVWALGCTVLEMATGLPPWSNIAQDPISTIYWIGFTGALPEIPEYLSDRAKDFLDKCLKRDPKERWSVTQLLKHPFLNDDGLVCGLSLDTPTSVLDRMLWENVEKLDSSPENSTREVRNLKSPNERINKLAEDTSLELLFSLLDDDNDDDAWITVRSKIDDETEKFLSVPGQTKPIYEPDPQTEFSYKDQNSMQFSKRYSKDKTIVEWFTCNSMQVYSSFCLRVSKNFLCTKSNSMAAKLSNAETGKVCNRLFCVNKFISSFKICTILQKSREDLISYGARFCDSLVYRTWL